MENNNIQSSITVPVNADEATRKIARVPEWWGISFSGSAEKLNDEFVIKMGGESFFNCTVSELVPGKRVVWLVNDCYMPWYADKKEWAGTKMIFDLAGNNGNTTITFTHEGLTPAVACYNDCNKGWNHWIQHSLFSYITTGKGDFIQR